MDEKFYAYDAGLPCRNPNCASHGKPHPNCKCYSEGMAQGGVVHYCAKGMPHIESCTHYATGGQVENNQQFNDNPDLAVDNLIANNGLHHLLTKTGHSQSPDPTKATQDFMESSKRGVGAADREIGDVFAKAQRKHDHDGVEALKTHLDSIQQDPSQLLKVGGSIGEDLPQHGVAIGAKAANAVEYLRSLKPMGQQNNPLDAVQQPSKMAQAMYDRQVHIAQDPLHIMNHIKTGRVQPTDLQTLHTLYPKLGQEIIRKAGETLIKAKTDGTPISYKHKMGLSALMGQPLDSTQTPAAMQAIIRSQPVPQPLPNKKNGATAATQETIEKTDKLYETPLDRRQIDRKS